MAELHAQSTVGHAFPRYTLALPVELRLPASSKDSTGVLPPLSIATTPRILCLRFRRNEQCFPCHCQVPGVGATAPLFTVPLRWSHPLHTPQHRPSHPVLHLEEGSLTSGTNRPPPFPSTLTIAINLHMASAPRHCNAPTPNQVTIPNRTCVAFATAVTLAF